MTISGRLLDAQPYAIARTLSGMGQSLRYAFDLAMCLPKPLRARARLPAKVFREVTRVITAYKRDGVLLLLIKEK